MNGVSFVNSSDDHRSCIFSAQRPFCRAFIVFGIYRLAIPRHVFVCVLHARDTPTQRPHASQNTCSADACDRMVIKSRDHVQTHPHTDALNMHLFKRVTCARSPRCCAALRHCDLYMHVAYDWVNVTQRAHVPATLTPFWPKSRERPLVVRSRCLALKCCKLFASIGTCCCSIGLDTCAGSAESTKWTKSKSSSST